MKKDKKNATATTTDNNNDLHVHEGENAIEAAQRLARVHGEPEAPKAEEPTTEALKVEAPKAEEPTTEALKVEAPKGATLTPEVTEALAKLSAHLGSEEKAIKTLQLAIKAAGGRKILVDGQMGPITIRWANRANQAKIVELLTVPAEAPKVEVIAEPAATEPATETAAA